MCWAASRSPRGLDGLVVAIGICLLEYFYEAAINILTISLAIFFVNGKTHFNDDFLGHFLELEYIGMPRNSIFAKKNPHFFDVM